MDNGESSDVYHEALQGIGDRKQILKELDSEELEALIFAFEELKTKLEQSEEERNTLERNSHYANRIFVELEEKLKRSEEECKTLRSERDQAKQYFEELNGKLHNFEEECKALISSDRCHAKRQFDMQATMHEEQRKLLEKARLEIHAKLTEVHNDKSVLEEEKAKVMDKLNEFVAKFDSECKDHEESSNRFKGVINQLTEKIQFLVTISIHAFACKKRDCYICQYMKSSKFSEEYVKYDAQENVVKSAEMTPEERARTRRAIEELKSIKYDVVENNSSESESKSTEVKKCCQVQNGKSEEKRLIAEADQTQKTMKRSSWRSSFRKCFRPDL